jgi:flagellar biosynthesis/type III secretory pathway chaperone
LEEEDENDLQSRIGKTISDEEIEICGRSDAQVLAQLRKDNHQIISNLNITSQHFLNIEAENSILRAQVGELSHRLQSLNEIITFLNNINGIFGAGETSTFTEPIYTFTSPLNFSYSNQLIMAAADMFQC